MSHDQQLCSTYLMTFWIYIIYTLFVIYILLFYNHIIWNGMLQLFVKIRALPIRRFTYRIGRFWGILYRIEITDFSLFTDPIIPIRGHIVLSVNSYLKLLTNRKRNFSYRPTFLLTILLIIKRYIATLNTQLLALTTEYIPYVPTLLTRLNTL